MFEEKYPVGSTIDVPGLGQALVVAFNPISDTYLIRWLTTASGMWVYPGLEETWTGPALEGGGAVVVQPPAVAPSEPPPPVAEGPPLPTEPTPPAPAPAGLSGLSLILLFLLAVAFLRKGKG